MTHFTCDICDDPAQQTQYILPTIITTSSYAWNADGTIEQLELEEIMPQKFNLCSNCKNKIAKLIKNMIAQSSQEARG